MVQQYELYFILNSDLDAATISSKISQISENLTIIGATNLKTSEEGVKRMAYPINKKWNGFYVSTTFELTLDNTSKVSEIERKINLDENIIRYIILNQTEYLTQKNKEVLKETEISDHRTFNKGRKTKASLSEYLGLRAIDFKDVQYLGQFASPYAKIFVRSRTGTSAKFQRKITTAIKRARHMALLPFTPKHSL
jgi:ribosomal protein S18/ribosomal protein S6